MIYKTNYKLDIPESLGEKFPQLFKKTDLILEEVYLPKHWSSGYLVGTSRGITFLLDEYYSTYAKVCTKCRVLKMRGCFYSSGTDRFGICSLCKQCEKIGRNYIKGYVGEDIAVDVQYKKWFSDQSKNCDITQTDNGEIEHIMPKTINPSWGNTKGNLMRLHKSLNTSKGNRNVFDWIDSMTQEKLDRLLSPEDSIYLNDFLEKYKRAITYKAKEIGLSYQQYKDKYNKEYFKE